LKQFQTGCKRRCFARTTVGSFNLVLHLGHFHIHDATVLLWIRWSFGRSVRFVPAEFLPTVRLSQAPVLFAVCQPSARPAARQRANKHGAFCSFSARPRPLGSDREPMILEARKGSGASSERPRASARSTSCQLLPRYKPLVSRRFRAALRAGRPSVDVPHARKGVRDSEGVPFRTRSARRLVPMATGRWRSRWARSHRAVWA